MLSSIGLSRSKIVFLQCNVYIDVQNMILFKITQIHS